MCPRLWRTGSVEDTASGVGYASYTCYPVLYLLGSGSIAEECRFRGVIHWFTLVVWSSAVAYYHVATGQLSSGAACCLWRLDISWSDEATLGAPTVLWLGSRTKALSEVSCLAIQSKAASRFACRRSPKKAWIAHRKCPIARGAACCKPKLVARLWTAQNRTVCSAELECQQAGASQHPPKKRQQAAAVQRSAPNN